LKKFNREPDVCLTIIGAKVASCQRVTESRTRPFPDDSDSGFRRLDFRIVEIDEYLFMDGKLPVPLISTGVPG